MALCLCPCPVSISYHSPPYENCCLSFPNYHFSCRHDQLFSVENGNVAQNFAIKSHLSYYLFSKCPFNYFLVQVIGFTELQLCFISRAKILSYCKSFLFLNTVSKMKVYLTINTVYVTAQRWWGPGRWWNTGTDFPERWSIPRVWWGLSVIWTEPLRKYLSLLSALKWGWVIRVDSFQLKYLIDAMLLEALEIILVNSSQRHLI